jgi:tocopherol O-methyltransferase
MLEDFSPQLSGPPIREQVRRFYDIGSPYYLELFGQHIHDGYYITGKEDRREAQENLIKLLVEKAHIKTGSRILDVGCGVGGSSIWLAQNLGASTLGITISPVQIEMANKLAAAQEAASSFLLMNAEEMSFPETFDTIWVVAALTHFIDQPHFLELARRSLKKKGQLVIYDWTVNEEIAAPADDPDTRSVIDGMVLAGLYPHSTYLQWLIAGGYRIIYSEELTSRTLKTWDIDLARFKGPGFWKLAAKITPGEGKEMIKFLKGRQAIKTAMEKGKVKSMAIAAEKI